VVLYIFALDNLERHPNAQQNPGNSSGFTVFEVIETAKKVNGVDISFEFTPRRSLNLHKELGIHTNKIIYKQ